MQKRSKDRDDETLVGLIATGDEAAFVELFDREMKYVYKLAYSHLQDASIAEDITQDVFTKLWLNAALWRPEAKIRTWLLRIARNACIDVLRKKKNDLKKAEDYVLEQIITHTPSAEEPYLSKEAVKETKKMMNKALFSLADRQKEAVTLVYYSGCSGAEAADIMGLTVSALESLLARARRNLRKGLSDHKVELMEGHHGKK